MKLSAILAPLLDAKVDHELIRQQILAFEQQQSDALDRRRASDAERQSRKRERDKSRDITLRHRDRSLAGGGARVEDKTSNSEIEPQEQKERNALTREFDLFWSEFPNKVGKPKARASFAAARKRAPIEAIMAGLHRYVASKPADRAWLNPTTFLNQDRWDDRPAAVTPFARGSPVSPRQTMADVAARLAQELNEANDVRSGEGISGIRQALPNLSVVSGR